MKWTFGKGAGSLQDLGAIGSEGEYYFHPNKAPAKLKGPPEAFTQKSRVIPIFPYTNVLVPLGSDWLNILEMRHRQLLGDVGDGLFGFCYYSQTQQKLGLVGTLARIKGTSSLEGLTRTEHLTTDITLPVILLQEENCLKTAEAWS